MERREGPQTPYEVYCHHCRSTFAAGTRNCVHCGGRLSGPGHIAVASEAMRSRSAGGAPLEVPVDVDVEAPEASPLRRFGGLSLWVLLAIGAALSRMCEGGSG
jgi:hypothetical protein